MLLSAFLRGKYISLNGKVYIPTEKEECIMWLARFLLDVVVCIGILAAIPKLLGTGVDLIGRIAGSINCMVRKLFRLDDDRAWGMDKKNEYKSNF